MPTQVIALNGGSSSGKSSIARCLQSMLSVPWSTLGVDTLIPAMPRSMHFRGLRRLELGPVSPRR